MNILLEALLTEARLAGRTEGYAAGLADAAVVMKLELERAIAEVKREYPRD